MSACNSDSSCKPRAANRALQTIVIIAAAEAIAWLSTAAFEFSGYRIQPQKLVLQLSSPDATLALKAKIFLLAVVLAPVAEELVFRLGIFRWGLRRFAKLAFAPAAAISAAVFAAAHLYPPGIPALFFLGFAFAWQYEKSGDLRLAIATHALFNLVNFAIALAM